MKATIKSALAITFILGLTHTAYAEDFSKNDFIANEKSRAAEKNWTFNEEKVVTLFNNIDTDKDGIATGIERKVYWDNFEKAKINGHTLEKFIKLEKERATQKGWRFNLDNTKSTFAAIDANSDGIASGEERKSYWDNLKNS